MKFLARIILPSAVSLLLGLGIYFKLAVQNIPFEKDEPIYYLMIITLLATLLVASVNIYFYSRQCKSCKKWDALRVISKEIIDEKPSHKAKTLRERNGKGEVIATKEVIVPSTIYTYLIHKKCRFCERVMEYTKQKNIEN